MLELKDTAKNLAVLHRVLVKNPIPYSYKMNQNYYRVLTIFELERIKKIIAKKNKDRFDRKVLKNINYLDKKLREKKETDKKVGRFKKEIQLIHFDFHPRNVIFNKNKMVAVLDFNAMRKDEKVEELSFASFRFASFKKKDIKEIKKTMKLFVDNYLLNNEIDERKLDYLNYYFNNKMLERISAILKKRYFFGCDWWIVDFDKNINFLKLAEKIGNFYER